MGKRIGGKDIDIMLSDLMIHVLAFTITIDDSTGVAKTKGVPNGYVDGETSAGGELEVDTQNFNLIIDAAKKAGSFKKMGTFDIVSNAETDDEALTIEAFGCKLRISDLLGVDTKGGELLKHKLPFDVTSPDFISINGVPYLDSAEIENIR
jgi:hypothetical protein